MAQYGPFVLKLPLNTHWPTLNVSLHYLVKYKRSKSMFLHSGV